MDKDSIALDLQFRFAPEDREAYGGDWYTYSELDMISTRGRELMQLEAMFGVPIPDLMRAFRSDAAYATMAIAWIASGRPVEWTEFNPLVMQMEWREKPEQEEPGKSQVPVSGPGESSIAQTVSDPFVTTLEPESTS